MMELQKQSLKKEKLILFLILSLLFSCKSSDEEAIKNLEQKFKIEEDFKDGFEIKEIEDLSFANSNGKIIKVIVPSNLKKERVEKNIQKIILDYLKENGQTKLHIKAYKEGDTISQYPTVARAEFLPQMGWDADDKKYDLKTYNLKIEYIESYFNPTITEDLKNDIREVEIFQNKKWDKSKREFVKANSVPISNSIREWTADKIIVEIPNNSKAKIIDEYSETLIDGSHFKRYKV